MRELYVWYHVEARDAAAAHDAVEAMQRSLEGTFPGLRARLLIRRDADRQTWMETFARAEPESGGIDAATEAAIAAAALALRPLLASDRHVEAFDVVVRAD